MSSERTNLLEKLLRESFCSDEAPDLTDELVDKFLESPSSCSQESQERIREIFIQKLFIELHPKPVRKIKDQVPFGRWLESLRKGACLDRAEIAGVWGKNELYLKRIECGDTLPWKVPASDFTALIFLIRLHIEGLMQLLKNTAAVDQARVGPVSARSHGGKMTSARGDSAKRSLDRYLARNSKPVELEDCVVKWIAEIRKNLESRNATELYSDE